MTITIQPPHNPGEVTIMLGAIGIAFDADIYHVQVVDATNFSQNTIPFDQISNIITLLEFIQRNHERLANIAMSGEID